MKMDFLNRYSVAQAVTATAASTNSIDHGEPRNLGVGNPPIYILCLVTVAFTDSGSDTTITVTLETDDNSAFGSPTVAQTLGTFAALAAVGSQLIQALQPGKVNERYTQLRYTTANGNLTTGSFTAGLLEDYDAFTAYASAVTIH